MTTTPGVDLFFFVSGSDQADINLLRGIDLLKFFFDLSFCALCLLLLELIQLRLQCVDQFIDWRQNAFNRVKMAVLNSDRMNQIKQLRDDNIRRVRITCLKRK
jgi:hypothetical protein